MNSNLFVLIVVQICLFGLVATIIYSLLLNKTYLNLEKRFNRYSLNSKKSNKLSLFDYLYIHTWKIIHKISRLLSKSQVLKRYGKKFDKNIKYYDNDDKKGIDFVSIKFIISTLLSFIYIISTFIRIEFNPMFLLLIYFSSFFLMDLYYNYDYKKSRRKIENELLNAIVIMNNAFKSGMNVIEALDVAEKELNGPIKEEFKKINMDIKYGLSIETVFDRFYDRIKIDDVKYLTSSISLINKTGGNIVRVFSSIEKNFYDKKKIKDEMNSLISSSLFMFRLLIIMPILLILVIFMLNPSYFIPLFVNTLGRIIILLILILYVGYIFIVRRIMKVDV